MVGLLSKAELLIVDEAAAIPLPIVKKLLGWSQPVLRSFTAENCRKLASSLALSSSLWFGNSSMTLHSRLHWLPCWYMPLFFSFICVTFRSARCTWQCFVVIFSCSFGITGCVPLLGLLNSFARPYLVLLASTVNGYEGRLHRRGWRVDSKTKRMRSWFETTTVQGCWVTIQARPLQPPQLFTVIMVFLE